MGRSKKRNRSRRCRRQRRIVQHKRPGMHFAKRSNPSRDGEGSGNGNRQLRTNLVRPGGPEAWIWSLSVPRAFIVCTEFTIKANAGPVRSEEDRCTLGQTLDLFLLPNAYLHQETIKLVLAQESLRLNHTRSIVASFSVPFSKLMLVINGFKMTHIMSYHAPK